MESLALKTLKTHEASDLPLATISLICKDQERSVDIATPRSLKLSAAYRISPSDRL